MGHSYGFSTLDPFPSIAEMVADQNWGAKSLEQPSVIVDRKVNFSWSNHVTLEKTHIAMENDRFIDDLPEHNDFSWQGITFPEGTG